MCKHQPPIITVLGQDLFTVTVKRHECLTFEVLHAASMSSRHTRHIISAAYTTFPFTYIE
jgi:hypothetical protein